jgi:hypothetical protein
LASPQPQPKQTKVINPQTKVLAPTLPSGLSPNSRSTVADKKKLDQYIRANGNMSVQRRIVVVGGAMQRLGYTPQQAEVIALDAPLDARMHDDEAVRSALEYGASLDELYQDVSSAKASGRTYEPDSVTGANAGQAVQMPDRAKNALQLARAQQRPIATRGGILGKRAQTVWDRIGNGIKPIADRLANVPEPTGIGGLFMLNLLFLFAIVPANSQGFTRLQLLWLTLMNRTVLPEEITPEVVPNSPVVQGVMDVAKSIEDAALAVGAVAGALGAPLQAVGNALQAGGQAIQQGNPALPVYNPFSGPGNPTPSGNVPTFKGIKPPSLGPGMGGGPTAPPPTRLGRKPPPPPKPRN